MKQIIPYGRQNGHSALACAFDSVPALHPTHDNPLAFPYRTLAIIFTPESQFHYWFTYKNALLSSNSGNF